MSDALLHTLNEQGEVSESPLTKYVLFTLGVPPQPLLRKQQVPKPLAQLVVLAPPRLAHSDTVLGDLKS